ncbi:MAG TPA: phospholipase D family protein [Steroidobacteraceae bacterium]|jgi:putative cardiolipin synthase|nr:phospholipase D family protein [Steroidobacteraceae bacterium]
MLMVVLAAVMVSGCASVATRGAGKPKSSALQDPRETRLGRQFLDLSRTHGGLSGMHLIQAGADGLAARVQIVRNAERTLDLQYFIFRGDQTGTLLTEELRHAADRGVRVRVIVDDGDTKPGDEHLLELDGYPNMQVRVFNPFDYRKHNLLLRNVDFLFHKSRLDYRMHNKLLVADNAIALIGGRNVGNEYFQLDPEGQFADDDVFVAGPIAQTLSKSFDEFWNSDLAVPAADLGGPHAYRPPVTTPVIKGSGVDYLARIATGEPYSSLISDRQALIWAPARVVYDSPDKRFIEHSAERGRLMSHAVEEEIRKSRSELLMVSCYFVPSDGELGVLKGLRDRDEAVKVLSNSLESAPSLAAQSGYHKVRVALLKAGVKLYEIRSRLDSTRGSGQSRQVSRYGNYSLHAKLYIFDRQRFFIGSWNYDQRSLHLNTEIGLIIDNAKLTSQMTRRFDAMTAPAAAYEVVLDPDLPGHAARLEWDTEVNHQKIRLYKEPSRGWWRKAEERLLALLPLEPEL